MYIPAAFRETRLDVLHALIREYSFGTLVSQVDGRPFATHLPFILQANDLQANDGPNGTLLGHMARANPHWHTFGAAEALVMFQGAHAYISPAWYLTQPAVPTWNYTAVYAYGVPLVIEDPLRVRAILEQLVQTFEAGRPGAWTTASVTEDYIAHMAQAIVAFEIPIARLEGKRKLGQNRPAADVVSAADALRTTGDATSLTLADDMLAAQR
jgi:transcriptional regulator